MFKPSKFSDIDFALALPGPISINHFTYSTAIVPMISPKFSDISGIDG
jgi:hypothetical protein